MNSSVLLLLNPQLCVRRSGKNPLRLVHKWRPLVVGPAQAGGMAPATARMPTAMPPTGGTRPRRRLAAKVTAALTAVVLAGVLNLSIWGSTRVEQQRATYRLARQLGESEALTRQLATQNRHLNAWLAASEARVTPGAAIAAASASPAKPLRRKQS